MEFAQLVLCSGHVSLEESFVQATEESQKKISLDSISFSSYQLRNIEILISLLNDTYEIN